MAKLVSLDKWLTKRFENPPSLRTARRWCEKGTIPAKKIGKGWYVDAKAELEQSGQPSVDELVSRVLKAG